MIRIVGRSKGICNSQQTSYASSSKTAHPAINLHTDMPAWKGVI